MNEDKERGSWRCQFFHKKSRAANAKGHWTRESECSRFEGSRCAKLVRGVARLGRAPEIPKIALLCMIKNRWMPGPRRGRRANAGTTPARRETAGRGVLERAMNRRKLLRNVGLGTFSLLTTGAVVYPFLEAKWCRVVRRRIELPNLPNAFRGTTIALLADIHHGPFVPLPYVRHIVAMTNALEPNLIVLAGDYVHRDHSYIAPSIERLASLRQGGGGSQCAATTTTGITTATKTSARCHARCSLMQRYPI